MIRQADRELKDKWAKMFDGLDNASKATLKTCLLTLREDALWRANQCWKKHKAPMALYWKVVGVYAGHLARSIRINKPENFGA